MRVRYIIIGNGVDTLFSSDEKDISSTHSNASFKCFISQNRTSAKMAGKMHIN